MLKGKYIVMYIVLLAILIIAALFDIVADHHVPIILPIVGYTIRVAELAVFELNYMKEYCMFSIIVFIMLFIMAFFGNLGGADCLIGSVCGLYLGVYALWGMLIAFILSLPYTIFMKIRNNEQEYAFIPYILMGMLITILCIKGGL